MPVGGQWKYLYRAVDKLGQTVDFLLTAHRDVAAARRFFERAIDLHDVAEKITIDKSETIQPGQSRQRASGLDLGAEFADQVRNRWLQPLGGHALRRHGLGAGAVQVP